MYKKTKVPHVGTLRMIKMKNIPRLGLYNCKSMHDHIENIEMVAG